MLSRRELLLTLLVAAPRLPAQDRRKTPRKKIPINSASAEELERLPGIGPKRAEMIIRMRQRNGPFRCVEELRAIPRLPEKDFLRLQRRVTVEKHKSSASAEKGATQGSAATGAAGLPKP